MFGEEPTVNDKKTRAFSSLTLTDCTIIKIKLDYFKGYMQNDHELDIYIRRKVKAKLKHRKRLLHKSNVIKKKISYMEKLAEAKILAAKNKADQEGDEVEDGIENLDDKSLFLTSAVKGKVREVVTRKKEMAILMRESRLRSMINQKSQNRQNSENGENFLLVSDPFNRQKLKSQKQVLSQNRSKLDLSKTDRLRSISRFSITMNKKGKELTSNAGKRPITAQDESLEEIREDEDLASTHKISKLVAGSIDLHELKVLNKNNLDRDIHSGRDDSRAKGLESLLNRSVESLWSKISVEKFEKKVLRIPQHMKLKPAFNPNHQEYTFPDPSMTSRTNQNEMDRRASQTHYRKSRKLAATTTTLRPNSSKKSGFRAAMVKKSAQNKQAYIDLFDNETKRFLNNRRHNRNQVRKKYFEYLKKTKHFQRMKRKADHRGLIVSKIIQEHSRSHQNKANKNKDLFKTLLRKTLAKNRPQGQGRVLQTGQRTGRKRPKNAARINDFRGAKSLSRGFDNLSRTDHLEKEREADLNRHTLRGGSRGFGIYQKCFTVDANKNESLEGTSYGKDLTSGFVDELQVFKLKGDEVIGFGGRGEPLLTKSMDREETPVENRLISSTSQNRRKLIGVYNFEQGTNRNRRVDDGKGDGDDSQEIAKKNGLRSWSSDHKEKDDLLQIENYRNHQKKTDRSLKKSSPLKKSHANRKRVSASKKARIPIKSMNKSKQKILSTSLDQSQPKMLESSLKDCLRAKNTLSRKINLNKYSSTKFNISRNSTTGMINQESFIHGSRALQARSTFDGKHQTQSRNRGNGYSASGDIRNQMSTPVSSSLIQRDINNSQSHQRVNGWEMKAYSGEIDDQTSFRQNPSLLISHDSNLERIYKNLFAFNNSILDDDSVGEFLHRKDVAKKSRGLSRIVVRSKHSMFRLLPKNFINFKNKFSKKAT